MCRQVPAATGPLLVVLLCGTGCGADAIRSAQNGGVGREPARIFADREDNNGFANAQELPLEGA